MNKDIGTMIRLGSIAGSGNTQKGKNPNVMDLGNHITYLRQKYSE